jgi:myo-inositol-1(or 4)-monophosphatase
MPADTASLPTLLDTIRIAAMEGGALAFQHFRAGETTTARVWSKAGGSPVTEADIAVDTLLKAACAAALPDAAWLSEETVDNPARIGQRLVWVVDPIDGTRAFMSGSPDWCVCVALLDQDKPVLGVVHAPALGLTYTARVGKGAHRNGEIIRASALSSLVGARIAGPKPMLDALAHQAEIAPQPKVPSLALRLARIADGQIDGGLISPDARDWDLAAADLILREAGGRMTDLDGRDLRYNRAHPVHASLAAAGLDLHGPLRTAALAAREQSRFQRKIS